MSSSDDARRLRWLDVFGALIGNTDRHLWNVTLFGNLEHPPTLAPVYDMLPMLFAPSASGTVERTFEVQPPTARTLDVWVEAAEKALEFWGQVQRRADLSTEFRNRARTAASKLEGALAAVSHLT